MADTSIITLLSERVVDYLEDVMINSVPDSTALGLARAGKLQDDPTVREMNLLIREGGDEWPDILVPENYPVYAPMYEIGNPSGAMLRRFYAQYQLFFVGEVVDRQEARRRANVIFSRFRKRIVSVPLKGMTDTFGETAHLCQFTRHVAREQGGPGSFIWKAEQYFEFLTTTDG